MPRDGHLPDQMQIIDPLSWSGRSPPAREWVVDGLIPKGSVTMLSGDGGLGKSLLTLQLLTAAATGSSWLGMQTMRCRAFGVYCEDDHDEIWRRMDGITRHHGLEYSDLEDVAFASRVGRDNLLMAPADKFGKTHRATDFYAQVHRQAVDTGVQLLVLDSLHDLFGGNENSRPEARFFVNLLRRIALDIDGAVVLCAHPSMSGLASGDGTSGSTAWNNAVRSRLYLSRPKTDQGEQIDPDARVLASKKSNYGATGFNLPLRWSNGVFVSDQPDRLMQRLERGAIAKFIAERVEQAWSRDTPLSATRQSGENYLPRALARQCKFKIADIEKTMLSMLDAGDILVDRRTSRSPKGLRLKPREDA